MRAGREGAPVADTPRRLSADKGTLNNSASVAKPSRPVAGPGSARPGKGGLSADKVEAYPRIRARPLIYWRISSQTVPPGRRTGQRPPRPMAGALHPPGRALPFGLFAPLLRHGRGLSADKGSTADLLAWAGRGVRARLPPTPPVAYPRIRVCCRERSSPNRTAPNRGHRLPRHRRHQPLSPARMIFSLIRGLSGQFFRLSLSGDTPATAMARLPPWHTALKFYRKDHRDACLL